MAWRFSPRVKQEHAMKIFLVALCERGADMDAVRRYSSQ